MDNTLNIYKYIKSENDVELTATIQNNGNAQEEWINIETITEQDIYYTIAGMDSLIYYRYDRNAKYKEVVYSENLSFSVVLDSRYLLGATEPGRDGDYSLYLIDILERKSYEVLDEKLKHTSYDHTRIIDLEGETYLAHIKFHLDSYEKEEIAKRYRDADPSEIDRRSLKEAVYLIKYEDFIYQVKNGYNKLSWDFYYEVNENKKVVGINYNEIIPSYILRQNYEFLILDYERKIIEYYGITHKKGLIAELIKEVSYEEYEDTYNLRAINYPVALIKTTNYETEREDRILYPIDYSFKTKLEANESLLVVSKDNTLSTSWTEIDGNYYEYIKIRDRDSLELLKTYEGRGVLLQDKRTLLLF